MALSEKHLPVVAVVVRARARESSSDTASSKAPIILRIDILVVSALDSVRKDITALLPFFLALGVTILCVSFKTLVDRSALGIVKVLGEVVLVLTVTIENLTCYQVLWIVRALQLIKRSLSALCHV